MDISKYFKVNHNENFDGREFNSFTTVSSSSNVYATRELNDLLEREVVKKKRQVLPEKRRVISCLESRYP